MLLKNGEIEKSRTTFIQAVVAEPYNPITWRALQAWAAANKLQLKRVHVETPNNVSQTGEKNITITMDPKASGLSFYFVAQLRIGQGEVARRRIQKAVSPGKAISPHSLAEEAEALTMAATVWTESERV